MAFTPNTNPVFLRQPNMGLTQITTTDGAGSANVTVVTGGSSNGSKVIGLQATGLTSAAFIVSAGIAFSGVSYIISTVSIPSNAGMVSGTPAVNLMSNSVAPGLPVDQDGNPFFFLRSSLDSVFFRTSASSSLWTAGNSITVAAVYGDF